MEEKLSCYVFLRTTEVIEVTQEITNTGIIPLEALRAHLSKGLTFWWRIQSGIFIRWKGVHFVLCGHSAHLQRIEVGESNFSHKLTKKKKNR